MQSGARDDAGSAGSKLADHRSRARRSTRWMVSIARRATLPRSRMIVRCSSRHNG